MTTLASTWNDLANSPRWRGVVGFIRNWIGPFESNLGMAQADLDAVLRDKGLNSQFVAAMIINDKLFADRNYIKLNRGAARAALTLIVSSPCGEFIADAPIETATAVVFAYPNDGPVYGRARSPSGDALLERLRSQKSA